MLYELLKSGEDDVFIFANNNINRAFGDTIMSLHRLCYAWERLGLKGKVAFTSSDKLAPLIRELVPFYNFPMPIVPSEDRYKDRKYARVAGWTCYDLYTTPVSYFKSEYRWKPSTSKLICHKIETNVKAYRVLPFDTNWAFQMDKRYTNFELPDNLPLCVEKLKSCAAFVGGDSGPTHLARSVGCPIVLVHSPIWDWEAGFPYGSSQVKPVTNPRDLEVALRQLTEV